MSDFPVPKYRMGQTVWYPFTHFTTKDLPCPDCLDAKAWKVTTPAGTELALPCPRCDKNFGRLHTLSGQTIPSLTVETWEGGVRRLTIGAVKIDTAARDGETVSYMAHETGIGSGSIYYEHMLFAEEQQAYDAATTMCFEQNSKTNLKPEVIQSMSFAGYQVKPAFRAADWASVYHAWDTARWLRETIDTIVDDEDGAYSKAYDIHSYCVERLAALRRYDFIDRHPFEALLAAAKTSTDPTVQKIAAELYVKFPSGDDQPTDDNNATAF
jgi:hypothetical protein